MEALDGGDPIDEIAIVQLAGELDVADPAWAEDIEAVLRAGHSRIVIDLTNVTFIDSSVVRSLILAHQRVGEDGWVRLVYTHHLITRVIQICGLADTFPQFSNLDAALRSVPTRAATLRSVVPLAERTRAREARESMMSVDATGSGDDEG